MILVKVIFAPKEVLPQQALPEQDLSAPKESLPEQVSVKLGLEGDFPNKKEGTVVFDMKIFMENIIQVNNKVPKYVIFAESQAIPGLVFRYNVFESVFEGGLPLIKTSEVKFLDGGKHLVSYTFKEGGPQKIFFDGKEVASGEFDSSKPLVTGLVISNLEEAPTIPFEGNVEFK
ncbi:MAG TPA: hypothetical protein VFF28_05640 [Candidatus Nanoarchaeia archaeon]|nr:hypothetical protein [Candidatus Nanoarchaeia archaeon]